MAINYFDYISSFTSKFKKTRVLNELVDDKTYQYLAQKNIDFANFIKQEGFCSYQNGLFSFVNPLLYNSYLELPNLRNVYSGNDVVIKTAFGDLITSDLKHNTVNSHHYTFYNEAYNCGSNVGYLITFRLTDAAFLKNFSKKMLFKKALEKFGTLQPNENFGFPMDFPWKQEKHLEKIENVLVYKTEEYFHLLSNKYQ
ncbi:MAG: hypothetical protein MUC49_16640 [Raineya sp.]|jgi:hypothetical protein|nr:hypothetical protein [Raineya sp.]